MVGDLILLATYGTFSGGAFGQMMSQWQQAGVFSYIIPFILIFALVFGILSKINLFGKTSSDGTENRTLNALIALSVAFMSLQFEFVSIFFAEIFPRMGVALIGVLVLLIVGGIFIDPNNKGFMVGLMVISMIAVASVLFFSFDALGFGFNFFYSSWWLSNMSWIIPILIVLVFVGVIIASANPTKQNPAVDNLLSRALLGK